MKPWLICVIKEPVLLENNILERHKLLKYRRIKNDQNQI